MTSWSRVANHPYLPETFYISTENFVSWKIPSPGQRDSQATYVWVLFVHFLKIGYFFYHTIHSFMSLIISNVLILQSLTDTSIISDSWGANYPFAIPADSSSWWLISSHVSFVPWVVKMSPPNQFCNCIYCSLRVEWTWAVGANLSAIYNWIAYPYVAQTWGFGSLDITFSSSFEPGL